MSPNSNEDIVAQNENKILELDMATEKIRARITDIIAMDKNFDEAVYLKCWLTAGKHNIDKTEKLIRDVLKWREENKSEEAIKSPLNPILEKSLRVYDASTRNGFLVATSYAGNFKLRETLSKTGVDLVVYYWLQMLARFEKVCIARAIEYSRKNPHEDTRTWPVLRKNWIIINAKNLSYWDCMCTGVIQMAVSLVKMATSYFPGLEGTIVIINAGKLVEFFLKAIRPLLKGSNVDLVVYGCNEAEWKAFIHQYVDPTQLRTPFGGTIKYDDIHNPDKDYM